MTLGWCGAEDGRFTGIKKKRDRKEATAAKSNFAHEAATKVANFGALLERP
jgi:hypothetical protein